jgi:hypothetical protein
MALMQALRPCGMHGAQGRGELAFHEFFERRQDLPGEKPRAMAPCAEEPA